jgi:hypothetical protein
VGVECKLLAAEGYEVMLLPFVLGSAKSLFECLHRATKRNGHSQCQKNLIIHQASPTQHTQSTNVFACNPTAIPGKTKANLRSKGKDKRQIASLPHSPILFIGADYRPTPTPHAVLICSMEVQENFDKRDIKKHR